MFRHVQAVVFDAVGTLIRPSQPVAQTYAQAGKRHGFEIDSNEIAKRFSAALQRQEAADAQKGDWKTSESRERERWQEIVTDVFCDVNPQGDIAALFTDLWNHFAVAENWVMYADAERLWDELSATDRVLAVASNLDSRLVTIRRSLPALDRCQHWFISSELGVRKPGRAFFRTAQERLGISPDQILLVGDDVTNDVLAARAEGWHAILLDRDAESRPPEILGDLTQLLSLLA